MYSHTHHKTILTSERKVVAEKLSKFRADNAISDRAIKQSKLAASKKKEWTDGLKAERDELDKRLNELNKSIFDKSIVLEQEKARFADPDLLRDATSLAGKKRAEANKADITISIFESQIRDHDNEKAMLEDQIKDLL